MRRADKNEWDLKTELNIRRRKMEIVYKALWQLVTVEREKKNLSNIRIQTLNAMHTHIIVLSSFLIR